MKTMQHQDVINETIGDWGRWQLRTSLLIFLCKIPSSWFMACIIFTAPLPKSGDYFCKPSESQQLNESQWIDNTHPMIIVHEKIQIDYCHIYDDKHNIDDVKEWSMNETDLNKATVNNSIIPCKTFHHKSNLISLITQFDLVCDSSILVAVTQFFHLFGVLTGGIAATKLLEYVSPRKVMLIGMITQVFCGVMTGIATKLEIHIFFRYLSAVCCAQMFTAGPVIFTEITGGKYKTSVTCLYENFWSIGVIILPAIAYFFPDWTNIYLAISLPTLVYILLWFLIPDAPRWLLRNGQLDKTRKVLIQATKINKNNKRTVPLDIGTKLNLLANEMIAENAPLSWWSLWITRKDTFRMIALHTAWAVCVTNYNGMLLNVKAFGRDYLSINTIIFGCSEIIGVLLALYLILKTNKKWLWTGLLNVFLGIFACTVFLLPDNKFTELQIMIFQLIPASLAKIAISTSQAILFTCTNELVQPEQRKVCIFSCIVWARIWLLTAPFIGVLMIYHPMLPLVVFGLLTAIGGLSTTVLMIPKTKPKSNSKLTLPIEPLVANANKF